MSLYGTEYTGTVDHTASGILCQRWDAQTPNIHTRTDPSKFPDETLGDAGNYCRNPDNSPDGPWCYAMEGTRFEYCNIELCG